MRSGTRISRARGIPRRWQGHAVLARLGVPLLSWILCGACTAVGTIGDGILGDDGGVLSSSGGAITNDAGFALGAGPHQLQRLSADEVLNSTRDLLGLSMAPAVSLPLDGVNESGFLAPGVASESDVRAFLEASETIVSSLTGPTWTNLVGCPASAQGTEACAQSFVSTLGKRAYRRPLTNDESTRLMSLYASQVASGASSDAALRLVLEAMLNSPSFLYHTEGFSSATQQEMGLVKLGGYELASRLSYLFTRTMPDDALFAAAENGGLDTADAVAAQARRLLTTPAARTMVAEFGAEWLGSDAVTSVSKDMSAFPQFDTDLRASMQAETRAFFQNVLLDGDRSWVTLMTAPFSMIDSRLAQYYGVTGVTGSGLQKVSLDPTQRFGFMTQGAILAVNADPSLESPIYRGKLIQTKLLCRVISPPPKAFPPPQPPSGQPTTVRQLLDEVHTSAGCNGCHSLLDPPGYAFGNYDAIGRIQTTEDGLPVDTADSLVLPSGATVNFKGGRDLVAAIAESADGASCFARQWFRFGLERLETSAESGDVASSTSTFSGSNFDVQELIVSVATSTAFRYRAVAPGEVLQ